MSCLSDAMFVLSQGDTEDNVGSHQQPFRAQWLLYVIASVNIKQFYILPTVHTYFNDYIIEQWN
jgi:hypothetical protein